MDESAIILQSCPMVSHGRKRARYWKPLAAKTCSYAGINTTEILRITGNWIYQGKSAIHIARTYLGQKKNYNGMHFWARGYAVFNELLM
jgi:hypothetical protein